MKLIEYPNIIIENIYSSLKNNKEGYIKFIFNSEIQIKYFKDIYQDINQLSSFLVSFNITSGIKVGIFGNNSYEFILLDLTLIYIGAIPIHLNEQSQIDQFINENETYSFLFHTEDFKSINNNHKSISLISEQLSNNKKYKLKDFINLDIQETIFTYNATSGTTSHPKFIQISKESAEFLINGIQELFELNGKDKVLFFLPQSIYLQRCLLYLSIIKGAEIVFTNFLYSFSVLKMENPSIVIAPPLFYEKLMDLIESRTKDISKVNTIENVIGKRIRVFWTGSAKSNIKTLIYFDEIGYPIYEGYGMSEFGMIAKNYPGNFKIGSVGKLFPNVDVKFDELGQIYAKNNLVNKNRFIDGTLCVNKKGYIATNDSGYIDSEGFLFLTGRLNEVIILSNGKKINPFSIELELMKIPNIKFSFLYGNDKPFITALLFGKFNNELKISNYIRNINSKLPNHSRIIKYEILELIDVDFTSKIIRRQIEILFHENLEHFYK